MHFVNVLINGSSSAYLSLCPVLFVLSATLVYCGQTAGRIKMPLGTEVGLGPGDILLDGDPAAPPPRNGHSTLVAKRSPIKCCSLDPVSTWLVKRLKDVLAPVICSLCNSSLQNGAMPTNQKHTIVLSRLKKSTMDPKHSYLVPADL